MIIPVINTYPASLIARLFDVVAVWKFDRFARRLLAVGWSHSNSPVAFIFEQQDEFSGQVKLMYDEIKLKNPECSRCMGSLTYAPKEKFIPLQLADKLAYEVMKNILNTKYDPSRPERKSLVKMKEARIIQILRYLDFNTIEKLVLAQPF